MYIYIYMCVCVCLCVYGSIPPATNPPSDGITYYPDILHALSPLILLWTWWIMRVLEVGGPYGYMGHGGDVLNIIPLGIVLRHSDPLKSAFHSVFRG